MKKRNVLVSVLMTGLAVWAQVKPEAFVTEFGPKAVTDDRGNEVLLDAAYRFDAWRGGQVPPTQEERERTYADWGDYANWDADFVISFSRPVRAGSVAFYGQTDAFGPQWESFALGVDLPAEGQYHFLRDGYGVSSFSYRNVAEMIQVFQCGVKNLSADNGGTTMTIELRLTGGGRSETLSVCRHRFPKTRIASWFDAQVPQYEVWPRDAALAVKGAWNAGTAALADVADVEIPGVLEVLSANGLAFAAEESKDLGGEAEEVVIRSVLDLEQYKADNLPVVDPTWKCGIVVGVDRGLRAYYGLAKVGEANVWVKLDGPDVQSPTELTVTLRIRGIRSTVTYDIGGTVCSVGGNDEIEIVSDRIVTGVTCVGCGAVHDLSATSKSARKGISVILK